MLEKIIHKNKVKNPKEYKTIREALFPKKDNRYREMFYNVGYVGLGMAGGYYLGSTLSNNNLPVSLITMVFGAFVGTACIDENEKIL